MTGSAALRLAVVGPTHPYKGGVAAHTTTLAHQLAEAGHDVTLVSWSHLYPTRLYPGEQAVPGGAPDVEPFPRTVRALSWARPDSWVRAGRRLREVDAIVVVHVIPAVIPAHLALLRAAGALHSGPGRGPRSVVVAHNVLPHERHSADEALVRALFRRVDAVIVHTPSEAKAAHDLDAQRVVVADLPAHLPGGPPVQRPVYDGPARLLALGMVRDYKGIDLLMQALTQVPGPTLTVAGEMWGNAGRRVKALAGHPSLRGRVQVHEGYVPADRLAHLFARHDVLALTYRNATASQNALLARRHGLAVLASDVGSFGDQVRDGVDGLLVPPNDEAALVSALQRLGEPAAVSALRAEVRPPDLVGPWARYLGAIEALASVESRAAVGDGSTSEGAAVGAMEGSGEGAVAGEGLGSTRSGQVDSRPGLRGGLGRIVLALGSRLSRRVPRLEMSGVDIPDSIRATDVLASEGDAEEARLVARQLGLPRVADDTAAWAALGALAAVLRVGDDGQRSAVVLDESGARSPFSRWARAVGFAPIELEMSGSRSSVAVLDLETASLDVMTRLHPNGCDAENVDEAMHQASWALRAGGLLCLTLPVATSATTQATSGRASDAGGQGIAPADLRALLARAADLGFVLVGDVDGELGRRLRQATRATEATQANEAAHPGPADDAISPTQATRHTHRTPVSRARPMPLVRLTLRRR